MCALDKVEQNNNLNNNPKLKRSRKKFKFVQNLGNVNFILEKKRYLFKLGR